MRLFLHNRLFLRNLYAQTLLENFLISGVCTILGIRFYLQMTGYPQVGGAHFHIAHMLYGGLLMMITIFILFTFLNRTAFTIASITGGIGFGFFIDELGKFITRDNNYFFQPTVALIYVIFILIYLIGELLPKLKIISKQEYLLNALELTKEVVVQDLDTNEKKQALAYLRLSDQSNPIVKDLRDILQSFHSRPENQDMYTKMKNMINGLTDKITQNRQFYLFVIFFIVIQSILSLLITFFFIAALNRYMYLLAAMILAFSSLYLLRNTKIIARLIYLISISCILFLIYQLTTRELTLTLSFSGWGTLLATGLAAIVAFVGLLEYNKSPLQALRYFRLSILISLFLTQFFLFYLFQFLALMGLVVNILMLLTIEFVIAKKESVPEVMEKH